MSKVTIQLYVVLRNYIKKFNEVLTSHELEIITDKKVDVGSGLINRIRR